MESEVNDLRSLKVGDEVVITADGNRFGGGTARVVVAGRKYITASIQGWDRRRFSADDGCEKSNGVGGFCYARTPAYHAHCERRDAVLARVLRATRHFSWTRRYSAEQLERIAAVLDEVVDAP